MDRTQHVETAVEDFRKVVLLANNIGYDKFGALFSDILGMRLSDDYIEDNWTRMRSDFASWMLSLDKETQKDFFRAAFEKYGD